MRIGWLGLVGVLALMASCKEDPATPPPPPPPDPPKFRVGGTLSGLSGSITLQLNGAESLTRTENGPFTFQTQLEEQGDYAVAIVTPPVEQDCTLQDARGKVNAADVASVKVSCAQRAYSISGTVVGVTGQLQLQLNGGEVISVTQDGGFTFQTPLPKDARYTVTVSSAPEGQRCFVSDNTGTVAGNVTRISARCYHWFALTNSQAANHLFGQVDFSGNSPHRGGSAGATTLDGPHGNPVLTGGRLYVADLFSNRILGFSELPTRSGASAAFVLGQSDFTNTSSGSTESTLASPSGISSDERWLAVADKSNHRILLHTTLPVTTGSQPNLVVGQPTFDSTDPRCDNRSVNAPEDVFIGHGKLIVADSSNNRVLVWNSLPTSNEPPADIVLGQTSFTRCVRNDANGDGTPDASPAASTLSLPSGVWTDGTRLVVADMGNHRVLIWNRFPTAHGQPADIVLGQPDFTSRAEATTAAGMSSPSLVASTGLQLFIAETGNNRVTVWNQFPAANGASADLVLGQAGFTSRNVVDPPTATSLYQPAGLLLSWPYVVVAEFGNNRLLFFQSQ
jgi:hypothetical protein